VFAVKTTSKVSPTECVVLPVDRTSDVSAVLAFGPTWRAADAERTGPLCSTADNANVLLGITEITSNTAAVKVPRKDARERTNRGILATPRLGSSKHASAL
jgi:hypothetical protein